MRAIIVKNQFEQDMVNAYFGIIPCNFINGVRPLVDLPAGDRGLPFADFQKEYLKPLTSVNQARPGDKVICLSDDFKGQFTKGKVYTVTNPNANLSTHVDITSDDRGKSNGLYYNHFCLTEKSKPKKEITAYKKIKDFPGNNLDIIHVDYENSMELFQPEKWPEYWEPVYNSKEFAFTSDQGDFTVEISHGIAYYERSRFTKTTLRNLIDSRQTGENFNGETMYGTPETVTIGCKTGIKVSQIKELIELL